MEIVSSLTNIEKHLPFLEQFDGIEVSFLNRVQGRKKERVEFEPHGLNLLIYHHISAGATTIFAVPISDTCQRVTVYMPENIEAIYDLPGQGEFKIKMWKP